MLLNRLGRCCSFHILLLNGSIDGLPYGFVGEHQPLDLRPHVFLGVRDLLQQFLQLGTLVL
jgi:hypothetical protein